MITVIACAGADFGIGANGDLLGYVKEDMSFFREKTINQIVVMGSNTARSLPNIKPLPDRVNYVLCREKDKEYFLYKGFVPVVCESISDCIKTLHSIHGDILVIGGAVVYREAIEFCDRLYLSIYTGFEKRADTFFPSLPGHLVLKSERRGETKGLSFLTYESSEK